MVAFPTSLPHPIPARAHPGARVRECARVPARAPLPSTGKEVGKEEQGHQSQAAALGLHRPSPRVLACEAMDGARDSRLCLSAGPSQGGTVRVIAAPIKRQFWTHCKGVK